MKTLLAVAFTLTLTFPALAIAQQPAAPQAPTYSPAEIKQLVKDAHTQTQYEALTSYYKAQQQTFNAHAQDEWSEYVRRSQLTSGPMQKYPRPVDSSKNRYEYFSYEAAQMADRAAYFEKLSSSKSE